MYKVFIPSIEIFTLNNRNLGVKCTDVRLF